MWPHLRLYYRDIRLHQWRHRIQVSWLSTNMLKTPCNEYALASNKKLLSYWPNPERICRKKGKKYENYLHKKVNFEQNFAYIQWVLLIESPLTSSQNGAGEMVVASYNKIHLRKAGLLYIIQRPTHTAVIKKDYVPSSVSINWKTAAPGLKGNSIEPWSALSQCSNSSQTMRNESRQQSGWASEDLSSAANAHMKCPVE